LLFSHALLTAHTQGFPLTYDDQIDFNTFLAATAHNYSMGVSLKNDIDQVADLVDYFDFAVNEQCFEYDECMTLLNFIEEVGTLFRGLSSFQFIIYNI
jgi:Glycoside-hydrolase family GH114